MMDEDGWVEDPRWVMELGSAAPLGMEPGRMGRMDYDRHQIIKLWCGVVACGYREDARVQLSVLLPLMEVEGYVFREDVDLMETLKRWDSRLLTNDSVLNLGELRLWFED